MVDETARQQGLDRDLVHALIRAESAYNPHAVSSAGAVGLMQVMPETAADYGVSLPEKLFEPATNLATGMRHFKRLLDKYGNIGSAVMAYNAGEGALERSGGFVTYAETQRYTHQVLTSYLNSKGIAPYSPEARAITGLTLSPAMAKAEGVRTDAPDTRLDTFSPAPDTRWQPTLQRPTLAPALRSQLVDSQNRLTSRLAAATLLKTSSLRTSPPRYVIQPPARH